MNETDGKHRLDATGRREVRICSGGEHTLDMIHAVHYDLEEFIRTYHLAPMEGRRIFLVHGPRRDDLDQHMRLFR